eukprot:3535362-Rhodomonas_salina.1
MPETDSVPCLVSVSVSVSVWDGLCSVSGVWRVVCVCVSVWDRLGGASCVCVSVWDRLRGVSCVCVCLSGPDSVVCGVCAPGRSVPSRLS